MVKKKDKRTNSCLQENCSQNGGGVGFMNSRYFWQGYVESYRWAINVDTAKETSTKKCTKSTLFIKTITDLHALNTYINQHTIPLKLSSPND